MDSINTFSSLSSTFFDETFNDKEVDESHVNSSCEMVVAPHFQNLDCSSFIQTLDQVYFFTSLFDWSLEDQHVIWDTMSFFGNQFSTRPELEWKFVDFSGQSSEIEDFTGKGKLTFSNGVIYEGDFINGEPCGAGKYIFPGGTYEGGIKQGKPNEIGKYTFKLGTCEGNFELGYISGKVTCMANSGVFSEGFFEKGKALKEIKQSLSKGVVRFIDIQKISSTAIVKTIVPHEVLGELKYEGTFLEGLTGKGKLTYSDNSTLEGIFQEGECIEGVFISPLGVRYEGKFKNGDYEDKGTLIFSPSSPREIYTGLFKEGKLVEGRLVYKDGTVYTGLFDKSGKENGNGEIVFSDDSICESFKGIFHEGKFQQGRLISKNGAIYDGFFDENGTLHGEGEIYFPEKHRYKWFKGFFNAGEFQQGTLILSNGCRYEGEFINDRYTNGRLEFPNGDFWEGTIVDKKLTGVLEKHFSDGSSYKGQIVKGKREGQGCYVSSDGEVANGLFINNMFCAGEIHTTFSNGDRHERVYLAGQLQEERITFSTGVVVRGSFTRAQSEEQRRGIQYINQGLFLGNQFITGIKKAVFSDGSCYEGEFMGDFPEGQGTYHFIDGSQISGYFNTHFFSTEQEFSEEILYQGAFEQVYLVLKRVSKKRPSSRDDEESLLDENDSKKICLTSLPNQDLPTF